MYKGSLSCSRVSSGDNTYVELMLRDNVSGKVIVEVSMSLEALAKVITGISETPCEFSLRNAEFVGKKKEAKEECFEFDSAPRFEDVQLAASPYEVDGWEMKYPQKGQKIPSVKRGNKGKYAVHAIFWRFLEA